MQEAEAKLEAVLEEELDAALEGGDEDEVRADALCMADTVTCNGRGGRIRA